MMQHSTADGRGVPNEYQKTKPSRYKPHTPHPPSLISSLFTGGKVDVRRRPKLMNDNHVRTCLIWRSNFAFGHILNACPGFHRGALAMALSGGHQAELLGKELSVAMHPI